MVSVDCQSSLLDMLTLVLRDSLSHGVRAACSGVPPLRCDDLLSLWQCGWNIMLMLFAGVGVPVFVRAFALCKQQARYFSLEYVKLARPGPGRATWLCTSLRTYDVPGRVVDCIPGQ